MVRNADYIYRSRNYVCDFTRRLNAQRSDASYCDVVLVADTGAEFPAHRCVLAAASEYFQVMFNINMLESTQSRIHLRGASASGLAKLLDFAYTGSLCITEGTVVDLLFLSSMLLMFDVTEACWGQLVRTLDLRNCIERKMLADSAANCEQVTNFVTAFVVENLGNLDANAIANCPADFVSELLSREDLAVESELDVFRLFLKWYAGDLMAEKEGKFSEREALLDCVRFAFLSSSQVDVVEKLLGSYGITSGSVVYDSILERTKTRSGSHEPRLSYKDEPVVVAVGGQDECSILSKVFAYVPSREEWRELSEMNYARKSFGLITINNDLFVVGGTVEKVLHRPMPFIERYNARNDTWEEIYVTSSNELERDNAGVVGFGGNVILTGGFEIPSGTLVSSVVQCNPFNGNCNSLASLHVAREGHAVVANGQSIYVIGGRNQSEVLDSVERYDVESETWTVLKPMNTGRHHACAVWFDDKLYVFGGYDGKIVLTSVELYDPEIDRWLLLPDMLTSRMKCGVSVFGEHAYVIGGMKGSRGPMVSDVEKFSFKDSTWSSVSCPMQEGRMELNCATISVPYRFLK